MVSLPILKYTFRYHNAITDFVMPGSYQYDWMCFMGDLDTCDLSAVLMRKYKYVSCVTTNKYGITFRQFVYNKYLV